MGNVIKYFQKLGMGNDDNKKPVGCFEKITGIWEKICFISDQLEVKYAVGKQISVQQKVT